MTSYEDEVNKLQKSSLLKDCYFKYKDASGRLKHSYNDVERILTAFNTFAGSFINEAIVRTIQFMKEDLNIMPGIALIGGKCLNCYVSLNYIKKSNDYDIHVIPTYPKYLNNSSSDEKINLTLQLLHLFKTGLKLSDEFLTHSRTEKIDQLKTLSDENSTDKGKMFYIQYVLTIICKYANANFNSGEFNKNNVLYMKHILFNIDLFSPDFNVVQDNYEFFFAGVRKKPTYEISGIFIRPVITRDKFKKNFTNYVSKLFNVQSLSINNCEYTDDIDYLNVYGASQSAEFYVPIMDFDYDEEPLRSHIQLYEEIRYGNGLQIATLDVILSNLINMVCTNPTESEKYLKNYSRLKVIKQTPFFMNENFKSSNNHIPLDNYIKKIYELQKYYCSTFRMGISKEYLDDLIRNINNSATITPQIIYYIAWEDSLLKINKYFNDSIYTNPKYHIIFKSSKQEEEFCDAAKKYYNDNRQLWTVGVVYDLIRGYQESSRGLNNYLLFKANGVDYTGTFLYNPHYDVPPVFTDHGFEVEITGELIEGLNRCFTDLNTMFKNYPDFKDEFYLHSIRHFTPHGTFSDNAKKGDYLKLPYYISTSYINTIKHFRNFAGINKNSFEDKVLFRIKVKKTSKNWMFIGRNGLNKFSESEFEVVINKDSNLRITGIKYENCSVYSDTLTLLYYEFKVFELELEDELYLGSTEDALIGGADIVTSEQKIIKLFGNFEKDLEPYKEKLKTSLLKVIVIPDVSFDITNVDKKNEKQYYELLPTVLEKNLKIIQYNNVKIPEYDIMYPNKFEKLNDFYNERKIIDKPKELVIEIKKPIYERKKIFDTSKKSQIYKHENTIFDNTDNLDQRALVYGGYSKFYNKYIKYKNKYLKLKVNTNK